MDISSKFSFQNQFNVLTPCMKMHWKARIYFFIHNHHLKLFHRVLQHCTLWCGWWWKCFKVRPEKYPKCNPTCIRISTSLALPGLNIIQLKYCSKSRLFCLKLNNLWLLVWARHSSQRPSILTHHWSNNQPRKLVFRFKPSPEHYFLNNLENLYVQ